MFVLSGCWETLIPSQIVLRIHLPVADSICFSRIATLQACVMEDLDGV